MPADLMHTLDIRTSYVFAFMAHGLLAGVLASFWRAGRAERGLGWWILDGLQLSMATLLLLAAGKLPPWMILAGSNLLIFSNVATIETALRVFLRDAVWPGLALRWLVAALAFGAWCLTWQGGWTYAQRAIVFSTAFLIQLALLLTYVVSLRDHGLRFVQRLLLLAILLVAGALFARMIHVLRHMDTIVSWQQDTMLPLLTFAATFSAFLRACCALYLVQSRTEQRLRAANQDIERRANFDLQTGVMSRSFFEMQAPEAIAAAGRNETPMAFVLIDVDHFKSINDTFGHLQGDGVLASVGQVLRHNTRGSDLVGRLGGDEFAIVLRDVTGVEAVALAERIRVEAGAILMPDGSAVSLSIGLCGLPPAQGFEAAYRCADAALYVAKQEGRGRVVAHDPLGVPPARPMLPAGA
ncbi:MULTISPECIES: GGDEF domain-containing protein [Cupriavidus]|uniref:diguanylate cyclase n=2 Tax=Cupriavidus metallidurans TaxID=119219 RepID=A0A482INJ8_9BURK|nr:MULTISPECIES: GGDEF domain-containing protein [Cupriavidus]KWR80423.1 diguanylate cyclase [Cupriavidus sp. SHE]QBP08410.1 GGDEF domain-containing protein [Cupriavidus metallidurans]QWC88832.1 GGDEF domain-containing protein [Cupriavidus metallidurans]